MQRQTRLGRGGSGILQLALGLFAGFSAGILPLNSRGAALSLVAGGRSAYAILVGPKAAPPERYAAGQLQHYLLEMTGARLPITTNTLQKPLISVGNTPFASRIIVPSRYRGDDGFRIRTVGTNLVLKGAIPRGTLFAVYAFLRRQGCWWFAPDAGSLRGHDEWVPHRGTLKVAPMNVLEEPAMRYRRQDPGTSYAPDDYGALGDWMAKLGANTVDFHLRVYEAHRRAILQAMQLRGMRIEVGKHEIMSVFLSPQKYGRAHPGWFGLINGRRVPDRENIVFETGNPAAVRTFTQNIVAYLKKRPEIDVFQLWPPDGCRWSQSPESRALGSPSERLARLVRQVTRAVKAAGLRTRISTIAYVQTMKPPRDIQDYSPNNIVEFCPIHRNYSVPFDALQNVVFLKDLRGWLARCPGQVTEYSYYSKESWGSLPVVLPQQIGADMKLWRNLGVCGVNLYNHPANWLPMEANRDAFARAAWSADFDGARWYAAWLKARFGKAAGPMRRYFHAATRVSLGALIAQSMTGDPARFKPDVRQARQAMEQAIQQAKTVQAKWAVDKLSWEPDYLADALRLRLAVYRKESGSVEAAAGAALHKLTAAHTNDGTYESGWGLRYRPSK